MTGKSRIMLVDDHPLVRLGLRSLLNHEADLMVCAEASTEDEALQALAATGPNIVLMDVTLGSSSGIELTRTIHRMNPSLPVLVLSLHEKASHGHQALDAGACGFVTKSDAPDRILSAIRLALAGRFPILAP